MSFHALYHQILLPMRGSHIFNGGVDICQPVGPINNWRKNYLIAMTVMPFFTWIKKHPRLGPLPHCVGQADVRELVQAKIWFDNMNECFSARLLVTYSGNMVLFCGPQIAAHINLWNQKRRIFLLYNPWVHPLPFPKVFTLLYIGLFVLHSRYDSYCVSSILNNIVQF